MTPPMPAESASSGPPHSLLRRVAQRAGRARLTVHRLPLEQWSCTIWLPRERGEDVYLSYHGDSDEEALGKALADPAADLRRAT